MCSVIGYEETRGVLRKPLTEQVELHLSQPTSALSCKQDTLNTPTCNTFAFLFNQVSTIRNKTPDSSHFAVVFLVLIALLFGLYALYHNRGKVGSGM